MLWATHLSYFEPPRGGARREIHSGHGPNQGWSRTFPKSAPFHAARGRVFVTLISCWTEGRIQGIEINGRYRKCPQHKSSDRNSKPSLTANVHQTASTIKERK